MEASFLICASGTEPPERSKTQAATVMAFESLRANTIVHVAMSK